jgi:hypothetical protein
MRENHINFIKIVQLLIIIAKTYTVRHRTGLNSTVFLIPGLGIVIFFNNVTDLIFKVAGQVYKIDQQMI